MKKISYDGIGAMVATFNVESSVATGSVVKLSDCCTVATCDEGDVFAGVVFDCEAPLAAIQMEGFVTVTCTAVVDLGYVNLVADGDGGVKLGAGGKSYLVVDNSDSGFVTICL